ncbi:MAG TPA: hypothetical protein VM577_11220 [Anaerovoracaceae bacterium]|nr:hypothetical protein [Anaerovoracaceae bacterium]
MEDIIKIIMEKERTRDLFFTLGFKEYSKPQKLRDPISMRIIPKARKNQRKSALVVFKNELLQLIDCDLTGSLNVFCNEAHTAFGFSPAKGDTGFVLKKYTAKSSRILIDLPMVNEVTLFKKKEITIVSEGSEKGILIILED